jgi:phosphate-selective porin OprO/OprP
MHDLTAGVNWYWNPHTRLMLNWIHAWTALPASDAATGTDVLAMRFQIDF